MTALRKLRAAIQPLTGEDGKIIKLNPGYGMPIAT